MSDETVYKAQMSELKRRIPTPLLVVGGGVLFLLFTAVFGVSLGGLFSAPIVSGFGLLMLLPAWKATEERQSKAALLAVPGAFFAMLGVLMFVTTLLRHEQSWAYAWLLLPAATVGGLMYARRFNKGSSVHKWGNSLLRILVALTLALALFMELLVFNTFGPLWPFLLIAFGIALFVRRQRSKA